MAETAESQMRDFLDDLTARLRSGDDMHPAPAPVEAGQDDVEELTEIIQALHSTLRPRAAPEDFAERLRADLLDGEPGVVQRLRQMPARVHIAAVLAVFAGCGLLMLRRVFGSGAAQDVPEEAVATPL